MAIDKYQKEAALLVCGFADQNRDRVARILREKDAEIEHLNDLNRENSIVIQDQIRQMQQYETSINRLNAAMSGELGLSRLRAEIAQLKALLAYAAPSVDHFTCLEPPYSTDQCKRCEIEKVLESK
jgi:hypothetical protein